MMKMSAKDQSPDQWLSELRKQLPDQGDAQILILDSSGVRDVWLSRKDIDRYQTVQSTKTKLQHQTFMTAVVVFALVIAVAFGYALQLSQQKEMLAKQLGQSDAQLRELTQHAQDVVQVAQRAGAGSTSPSSGDMVGRLRDVAGFIESQDKAFTVYAEFTRELVKQHLTTLNEEFNEAGIGLSEALESVVLANESGIGGPIELDGQLGEVIDRYVELDATAGLEKIAQINLFRSSLPGLDPVVEGRLTSGFGMRRHPVTGRTMPHRGIDMVSYESRDVLSAGVGTVTFADYQGLYGNLVVIDHGSNIETRYAHLSEIHVAVGDRVKGGSKLGYMGSTGRTTGKHLHFEVRFDGRHIDPVVAQQVARNVQ